jgi:hypothetical protein
MGASGTLTEHEVIVHPVHVWGVPLRVPRGRYSIQGFRQILIDERLSRSSSQGLRSVARVYLVGTGGTPAIEVISDTSDVAAASAQQLSALLRLEIVRGKLGVA